MYFLEKFLDFVGNNTDATVRSCTGTVSSVLSIPSTDYLIATEAAAAAASIATPAATTHTEPSSCRRGETNVPHDLVYHPHHTESSTIIPIIIAKYSSTLLCVAVSVRHHKTLTGKHIQWNTLTAVPSCSLASFTTACRTTCVARNRFIAS